MSDFLLRRSPKLRGRTPGEPLIDPSVDPVVGAVEVVKALDCTALCIQGPPGSGKTFAAARMIVQLLQAGQRVGVASNGHKAIVKLMEETLAAADEVGLAVRALKIGGEENEPILTSGRVAYAASISKVDFSGPTCPQLVGGTAYAFSSPIARGQFDCLFVDEAGQVSVANLLGMSPCARNLVLLGDQMQLGQPIQGSHPGESGLSALHYLLHDRATISDDAGIFLNHTRRMHPDVCRFVSQHIYEGRLRSHACTKRRVIGSSTEGASSVRVGSGIVFVPVEHEGNSQGSDEEVQAIQRLVAELLGRDLTNEDGVPDRKVSLEDILVVAPYNMQVRKLKTALGRLARVGTVDKFQGQEAAIVIISMCASSGEVGPRGIEFLFSPNRLNVAISRARSVAVIVGSPRLTRTPCRTVRQVSLVNLFCHAVEGASR